MLFVLIGAFVALCLLSVRFGADSRPGERDVPPDWVATPRAPGK